MGVALGFTLSLGLGVTPGVTPGVASAVAAGAVIVARHSGQGPVTPAICDGTCSLLSQLGQWKTMILAVMLVGFKGG